MEVAAVWRGDSATVLGSVLRARVHFRVVINKLTRFPGTFSKRSAYISGRRPLGQDPDVDYEVDSADEWEEDEPGEELKSEDEEEEEEDADAPEEEEKDWLVPHGYLSDDEGVEKDEGEVGGGGEFNRRSTWTNDRLTVLFVQGMSSI